MNLASYFSPSEIIKKISCFSQFELCFETKAGYIFSFLSYETLKEIVTLFFSSFSQSPFSDGKFIPSQFLFIKDLICVILCGSLFISS